MILIMNLCNFVQLKLDHSLSMDTGDAAILTKDISSLEKVSSKDISLAASIALSCNPAYAVLGRTFGTLSFPSVLQLLK